MPTDVFLGPIMETYLRRLLTAWKQAGIPPKNVSLEFEPSCRNEDGLTTPWIICVIGESQNYRVESHSLDRAYDGMVEFAAECGEELKAEQVAIEAEEGKLWD